MTVTLDPKYPAIRLITPPSHIVSTPTCDSSLLPRPVQDLGPKAPEKTRTSFRGAALWKEKAKQPQYKQTHLDRKTKHSTYMAGKPSSRKENTTGQLGPGSLGQSGQLIQTPNLGLKTTTPRSHLIQSKPQLSTSLSRLMPNKIRCSWHGVYTILIPRTYPDPNRDGWSGTCHTPK